MTKGQAEASVTEALSRFKREFLGRGPKVARTHIYQDMVIIRLTAGMSQAEIQLSQDASGVELFKRMRTKLIEGSDELIKKLVEESVGLPVKSMHTDISSRTGESVFVFSMEGDLESRFDD